jgi:ATP-binding cassette subfamily B protein
MSVTGKAFDSHLLKRIFQFTKPYNKLFTTSVILTVSIALLSPLRPLLTQYILDHLVPNRDVTGLIYVTLVMIGLLLVQSIIQYFHSWSTNFLGQSVIRDLRTKLFDRMMSFKFSYFDKTFRALGASGFRG